MNEFLAAVIDSYIVMFYWLCGLFILFSALEFVMPCNPGQPKLRKGIITDVLYYFIIPFLSRFVRMVFMAMGIYVLFYEAPPISIELFLEYGYGPLASWPVWLQAAVVFILSDIALYWLHRWFHGAKMWRFHAIHHSSQHVDWLSTY